MTACLFDLVLPDVMSPCHVSKSPMNAWVKVCSRTCKLLPSASSVKWEFFH